MPQHFNHGAHGHVAPVSLRNDGCTRCSQFVRFRKVEQRIPVDFLPQSRAHFAGKVKSFRKKVRIKQVVGKIILRSEIVLVPVSVEQLRLF